MITIQLDNVPVVSKKNKMKISRGRIYKPADVQDFEHALQKAAAETVCNIVDWQPLEGNLRLDLHVQFPDRRRRDLHNCFDTICDALQNIVYNDDNQIFEVVGRKTIGKCWKLSLTITEI